MSDYFKKLGEALFGRSDRSESRDSRKQASESVVKPTLRRSTREAREKTTYRDPYFVQIGFDFGTAFCKCVCRDVLVDKAWVHIPTCSANAKLPFLLQSAVSYNDGRLEHVQDTTGGYKNDGLYYIKMAMQKIGLGSLNDPILRAFREALPKNSDVDLPEFVECCGVYLLAGAFGNIKADIAKRFPGTVEGDYIAINMAVPVADADHPGVNTIFDRVLRLAWVLSDEYTGHPPVSLTSLQSAIRRTDQEAASESTREACFIYPEVSANVQGFVRSPNSAPGLYLFSDTGAGTVDQSVLLFAQPDGQDHLTYLHAEVLPLGSSHIEQLAARQDGDTSWSNIERRRKMKESGHVDKVMSKVRHSIQVKLLKSSTKTIACSKQKLPRPNQINDITLIFGGGGHCKDPYRSGAMEVFEHSIFRQEEIEDRHRKREPFDIGMPFPRDLSLNPNQERWFSRLTVAYGLAFERGQLATFELPSSVPVPEKVLRRRTAKVNAISKDDV